LPDDVGFGASSTFGGDVETPNIEALANGGCDTPTSTRRQSARRHVPRC
jgi:hypothetical protein